MLQWPPDLAKVQPHQRVQVTKRGFGTFVIDELNSFKIKQEQIFIVDHFIFLGSRIDKMGGWLEEVERRIAL
ncbi:hypothetical protein LAZ67_16002841 [Cordylochernes scorpioides]|uniref:Uncharacterized protein n=1 Tax=Cordylochernes scorpioides TaxID=51811 RepID=A0ABY6LCA8_9ARAC|nr:hypothetical protein LAZ67_16002841 [Cordylochernes scorpioides]